MLLSTQQGPGPSPVVIWPQESVRVWGSGDPAQTAVFLELIYFCGTERSLVARGERFGAKRLGWAHIPFAQDLG